MSVESQNLKVLNHLRNKGPLTPLAAMNSYGITRLAARINDLRKEGHEIQTKMITVQNRDFDKVRIAEYRMLPPEQPTLF